MSIRENLLNQKFLNYNFRPFIRTLGMLPHPTCKDRVIWTSCLCRLWARGSACMSARPWVFRHPLTKQITATWGIPEVLATGVVFFSMGFSPLSSGEQTGVNHAAVWIPALISHPPLGSCRTWPNIVSGGRNSAEKTSWGEGSWNPILYRVLKISQVIVGDLWTINIIFRWACWSPKKLKTMKNRNRSKLLPTSRNVGCTEPALARSRHLLRVQSEGWWHKSRKSNNVNGVTPGSLKKVVGGR